MLKSVERLLEFVGDMNARFVYKFDSPNNQCSHVGIECDYEEEDDG